MGAPDADALLDTAELRRRSLELRGLLIAAQRSRRAALIAALAPLAPLRQLADATEVGEDVPPPAEDEWLAAVECMAEPLCAELAQTLEDAAALTFAAERADTLQAALDAQLASKLAEHDARMAGGGAALEVDVEDLARDREALMRAAMPASRAAGHTRQQCYAAALRRDTNDATARAELEAVRAQLRVTWREKGLADALTALRDGRAGAGWLVGPEAVFDDPWSFSDAQLERLTRGARVANAAPSRELNEAAVFARDALQRAQFSKHGTNLLALARARRDAVQRAEAEQARLPAAAGAAAADYEARVQAIWLPVYRCDALAQPTVEDYADAYFCVRRNDPADRHARNHDALFLAATHAAEALYRKGDDAGASFLDEATCLEEYQEDLQELREVAASSGACVAAYDTFAGLVREMRLVRKLRERAGGAWPPTPEAVVDFVTDQGLNNAHWQRTNHRGRTGAEETVRRALVWCCGLAAADAATARDGAVAAAVAALRVHGDENRRDGDAGVYPMPTVVDARFPELPSLDAAAAALLERRRRTQLLLRLHGGERPRKR